ncbi:MAG: ATP-binding cassette domain-containing protein, partial [Gloeomargaritaceae cyanobacterium C42_A2020_066]|nr:ATP-binding cassette domain-containing protein [Gloeomargaritaceae cyanobacterium C42_A2020_066]
DVHLTVPDGQFWVLMGPSGCGKSTLLRLVAGLEAVQIGQVWIGERCVNRVAPRDRDVAMVFQNYALYPHLTVAENLGFGLRMRGIPAGVRRQRVQQVAVLLGLEAILERKPHQLSGGQQQRVALGRAIVREPQVFLMDEPLSNLDARLRDQTRTELKRLHQQLGVTTLYVTHDQTEAMTLAEGLVVLHQGQVQQIGSPQALYQRPANRTVASFLGSPPMNLLNVPVAEGYLWLAGRPYPWPVHIGDPRPDRVDLGLRPESLGLVDADAGLLVGWVGIVEPLGAETLVWVELDQHQGLWARLPGAWAGRPGARVGLTWLPQAVHLFDVYHGQRLPSPSDGLESEPGD